LDDHQDDGGHTTPSSNAGNQFGPWAHWNHRSSSSNKVKSGARCNIDWHLSKIKHHTVPTHCCGCEGHADLYSHADTCLAGPLFWVIEYLDQFCDVSPFLSEYEPLPNVPIVNAATAYHHPDSGELFILLFNQVLYTGDQVEASLLCPNQMHAHGVIVEDCPIHLSPNHSSTHSIYVLEHDLRIPLQLNGIFLYIDTFCPLDDDLEHGTWVEMTLLTDWDPYSQDFLQQEEKAMSEDGEYFCCLVNSVGTHQALSDVVLSSVLPSLTPELLLEELDLRVAQVLYMQSEVMATKAGAH